MDLEAAFAATTRLGGGTTVTLRDKLPGRTLTETSYLSFIGIAGGYCLVTMVLVPILTIVAGGYLALTHQYAIASGLTVLGFTSGYWIYQQKMRNGDRTAETT